MIAQLKKGLEIAGVVAPIVCLIHCLATPILLTALPFLTVKGEGNDAWFHWLIVGMCALAVLPAYRTHKKIVVPVLFTVGGAFVLLPEYVKAIEATVPTVVTAIAASACLVSANLLNTKYSKELSGATACCAHNHQSQHSEV